MPVHFHIHLETGPAWGLAEKLHKEIHDMGLVTVDHRTINNRGLDATIVSDIYVRDDNLRIELPTIAKQKKTIDAVKAVEARNSLTQITIRVSSMNLFDGLDRDSGASDEVKQLGKEDQEAIQVLVGLITDEAKIEQRVAELKKLVGERLQDLGIADLEVKEWNPWDWSAALRTIMMTRKDGKPADLEFFMDIFHKIDVDGSGAVDEDELYAALKASGIEVTRDGLKQMIAVVDENNDGEISTDEWKDAIEFFLASKEEVAKRDRSVKIHALLGVEVGKEITANISGIGSAKDGAEKDVEKGAMDKSGKSAKDEEENDVEKGTTDKSDKSAAFYIGDLAEDFVGEC